MKISNILQRISTANIHAHFISKEAVKIMGWMRGDESLNPKMIYEYINEYFSYADMLRTKQIRQLLLSSLREEEVIILLQKLGKKPINNNIYKQILNVSFSKNNNYEKILFDFFEVDIPYDQYSDISIHKDIEIIQVRRKLFPHQRDALEGVIEKINSDPLRCLLHMPTGSGKTTTAMRVVTHFFLKSRPMLVIWLAYNEELCEQAIDEFQKIWNNSGDRDVKLLRFFRKHNTNIINETQINKEGLIVAGLSKIYEASKRDVTFLSKLADRVDLVIMDEAHQATAPTYSEILEQLTEKHRNRVKLLGLSATPGNSNQINSVRLSSFFNRTKETLNIEGFDNPIDYLIHEKYIAEPHTTLIDTNGDLDANDLRAIQKNQIDIPEEILEKLGKNTKRTLKIIIQIQQLLTSGHKRIMVFGASVKNSRDISIILNLLGHKSFHIDTDTQTLRKQQYIDEYKSDTDQPLVMCNFGIFTAGFDAPKTSAVVIARPTRSLVLYSQMVGRGMRGIRVCGNEKCEIHTITDVNIPQFTNLIANFFEWEDIW